MKASWMVKQVRKKEWKSNVEHFTKKQWDYGVNEWVDIPYQEDGKGLLTLDVYEPKKVEKTLPVIFMIHGGGYIALDKFINRCQGHYFASRGFRVVNVNYSLQPEADFIRVEQELFQALSWVKRSAKQYRFDLEHLFVYGDSAGGHYALLMGLLMKNPSLQVYYQIPEIALQARAVAVSCPMYDIRSALKKHDATNLFLRWNVLSKAQKKDEDYIRQVSIQEMIGQYAFPELFLLTTPTDAMLYDAVATLHRKLEAGKVVHRYKEYVSDERELQHVFHAVDPELPESMKANEEILQFYREYL